MKERKTLQSRNVDAMSRAKKWLEKHPLINELWSAISSVLISMHHCEGINYKRSTQNLAYHFLKIYVCIHVLRFY